MLKFGTSFRMEAQLAGVKHKAVLNNEIPVQRDSVAAVCVC